MQIRKRALLRRAAVAALFLFVLEICARIDDVIRWNAPFFKIYSVDNLFGFDDEGIPINIPKSRFEKWHNNSFGFRGPEISLTKPPGIIRIICMGTSETYGTSESPGHEWPTQLGQTIAEHNSFEIINTAGPGFSFQYYRRFFEKYIQSFDPDVVILIPNPYFHAIRSVRAHYAKQSDTANSRKARNRLRAPNPSILSHIRILPKVKRSLKRILPQSIQRRYYIYTFKRLIARAEKLLPSYEFPLDAVPEYCVTSYQEELINLIFTIKKNNIRIILGAYPSLMNDANIDLYPELFLGFRNFGVEFSFRGEMDISRKYKEATRSLADQLGLIFVDTEELVPKDTLHFSDNVHFTDAGARVVANAFGLAIAKLFSKSLHQEKTGMH